MRVPKLVHHLTTWRAVPAVQAHGQFAVQMADEIAMRGDRMFEAHDQVIMIGEECPSLQDERITSCQLHSRVTQKIQLCFASKKWFSVKRRRRDDIGSAGRETMRRRMRPVLAHAISYQFSAGLESFRSTFQLRARKSGAETHR